MTAMASPNGHGGSGGMGTQVTRACDACMRRTWLLGRLGGYLDHERGRVDQVLGCSDQVLTEVFGRALERRGSRAELERDYAAYGAARARTDRRRAAAAGLETMCRCDPDYPERLRRLSGPPAVLHVAGGLERLLTLVRADPVAVVGTRRANAYGCEMAARLGRGISASGLCVVSGMALGVDAAAHRGALAGGANTIAVSPGCAAEPYPRTNRRLHERIVAGGAALSEFGPGAQLRRWTFIARNRVIAALCELVIVVQAGEGSGAMTTASLAGSVGARVGAVPGVVGAAQSDGPHSLIREGATLIRDAQDVLDAVFGPGVREWSRAPSLELSDRQRAVLEAIGAGADTLPALSRARPTDQLLLATLAELELAGCLRRATGGRYVVTA